MTIYCEKCALFLAHIDGSGTSSALFLPSHVCFCSLPSAQRANALRGYGSAQENFRKNLMRVLIRLDVSPSVAGKIVSDFFPLLPAQQRRIAQMGLEGRAE